MSLFSLTSVGSPLPTVQTRQVPKVSNTSTPTVASSSRSSMSNPAVWGSIVGAVTVVFVIIAVLLFFLYRLKRRRRREMRLRDRVESYSNRYRFSSSSESPADPPPSRPKREEVNTLYVVSTPTSTHHGNRDSMLHVNTAAGRVHSHQASLTLISPLTPHGSSPASSILSPPDLRFLNQHSWGRGHSPAPSLMSPSSPYGDSASVVSSPGQRLRHQDSQQSLISPAINSPSVLLSPPERFGSRDSKRYLAYLEAQRAQEGPQTLPTSAHEDDSEWRTSWQDVADPPPSYPGHNL